MGQQLHRAAQLPLLLPVPAVAQRAHGGRRRLRPGLRAEPRRGAGSHPHHRHVSLAWPQRWGGPGHVAPGDHGPGLPGAGLPCLGRQRGCSSSTGTSLCLHPWLLALTGQNGCHGCGRPLLHPCHRPHWLPRGAGHARAHHQRAGADPGGAAGWRGREVSDGPRGPALTCCVGQSGEALAPEAPGGAWGVGLSPCPFPPVDPAATMTPGREAPQRPAGRGWGELSGGLPWADPA